MMTSYIVNIQHWFPSQARKFCYRTQGWERSAHTSWILNKQTKNTPPNSSQHFTATTRLHTSPSAKQNPDCPSSWNLLFSYLSLLCPLIFLSSEQLKKFLSCARNPGPLAFTLYGHFTKWRHFLTKVRISGFYSSNNKIYSI